MFVFPNRYVLTTYLFFFLLAGAVAPVYAATSGIKMLPPMKETDMDDPDTDVGCPSNDTKIGQVLSWDGKTSIKCNSKLLVDTDGNANVGAELSVTGKTRPSGGLVLPTTAGNEVGQMWLDTSVPVGP